MPLRANGQERVGGSRNLGIAESRTELIALTDDDGETPTTWLWDLVGAFAVDPRIGIVHGVFKDFKRSRKASWPDFSCQSAKNVPPDRHRHESCHKLGWNDSREDPSLVDRRLASGR
jgi:hypothetical protein